MDHIACFELHLGDPTRVPLLSEGREALHSRRKRSVPVTFAVGQKAVYPSRGIAEIIGIEKKEIHGHLQSFYLLRLTDSDLRIMVPTDKADQVGLRPVAGSDDVNEVLQILRESAVRFDRNTWNRR